MFFIFSGPKIPMRSQLASSRHRNVQPQKFRLEKDASPLYRTFPAPTFPACWVFVVMESLCSTSSSPALDAPPALHGRLITRELLCQSVVRRGVTGAQIRCNRIWSPSGFVGSSETAVGNVPVCGLRCVGA